MTKAAPAQPQVDAYFDAVADWWHDVYGASGIEGVVYRRRLERVLAWIDELGLPPGSSVLDVGAGAGLLSSELLRGGHQVLAIDSSRAMTERLRERARTSGSADRLQTAVADVHALDLPERSFDLVVALGVLPWLHRPAAGLREMTRVARGPVILTSDNADRLTYLLDPATNRRLERVRIAYRWLRARLGRSAPRPEELVRLYRQDELVAMLVDAGLVPERLVSVGFGPFSFRGRQLLPEALSLRVDDVAQRLADRGFSLLRLRGSHHVVLARRRPPR